MVQSVVLNSPYIPRVNVSVIATKDAHVMPCVLTRDLRVSAHVGTGQVMGWGEKAIEVRSVETGLLDGVFMHKRAQTFSFLCERNEKVSAEN